MIKIGDKEFRNLEEQVGFLSTREQLSTLGLSLVGIVPDQNSLPQESEERQVYAVGAEPPYEYFVYLSGVYSSLGVFPLAGPPGVPGDRGKQGPAGPIGPKGDKGNQGIAGPAGGGVGVDHVTNLNLSTGSAAVTYTDTNGATLTKSGRITAAGTNYDIDVNDKIPIIAGDNVTIAANASNTAIKVSANVPVTSVNGQTGAVTITVPTKTSQLTNDSDYITSNYHDNTKQDTLVSGTNIKTINNQSLLGSGNITISGGGGTAGVTSLNGKTGDITLSAGTNVTIDESNNTLVISATGGGGSSNVKQTTGFYRYDGIVNTNPVVGGTYQYNDTLTLYEYTGGCTYTQGQMIIDRNGVISKVIDETHARVAYIPQSAAVSSVNSKTGAVVLKTSDIENDSNYVTTSGCVTKMMNQNGTNESNGTIFVGSGLNLANNILTATGGGGGSSTLYQHHITLTVPAVYTSTNFDDPSGEATIEFSFYSPHAPFNDYEELFNWMNSAMDRWIDSCNGVAYNSNFSVDGQFSRIKIGTSLATAPSVSYYELSKWEPSVGWTPVYYIKEKGMMDSHSLTDSAGEM